MGMRELTVQLNKNGRITSIELVEIINTFRQIEKGEKYKELQHRDFTRKIKKELETLEILGLEGVRNISQSSYVDSQGKTQPCYSLNRDGMLQMLNSESPLVRYKTIEYINKLEDQLKEKDIPKLPQTYKEALIALVQSIEEKEKLEAEKNKLIHQNKTYTSTEIAKELGFKSAIKFNKILEEKKIQYKVNGTWVLCARYSECGYQSIKQIELEGDKVVYDRRWTGKGRDWLVNEIFKINQQ